MKILLQKLKLFITESILPRLVVFIFILFLLWRLYIIFLPRELDLNFQTWSQLIRFYGQGFGLFWFSKYVIFKIKQRNPGKPAFYEKILIYVFFHFHIDLLRYPSYWRIVFKCSSLYRKNIKPSGKLDMVIAFMIFNAYQFLILTLMLWEIIILKHAYWSLKVIPCIFLYSMFLFFLAFCWSFENALEDDSNYHVFNKLNTHTTYVELIFLGYLIKYYMIKNGNYYKFIICK